MSNPNVLNAEARKLVKKWAAQDMYVYMRPMSGVYVNDPNPKRLYWIVSVEYRAMSHQQIRGEGWDLSTVIITMSGRVPNREMDQPGYKPGKETGWLAAKEVAEKQLADMRKARKKAEKKAKNVVPFERPRKKKSKKKIAAK